MAVLNVLEVIAQKDESSRFGASPEALFHTRLAQIERRISQACANAGRERSDVRLLPITKTVPAETLRHAYAVGLRDFAENKVQEARAKIDVLTDLPVRWTMVGHLQKNKAKQMLEFAQEFHALDSMALAVRLNRLLAEQGRVLDVYVQVNTSGEASKYGLVPQDLPAFLDVLETCTQLRPRGLMTLAVFSGDRDRVRRCFRILRKLRDQSLGDHPEIRGLSMGMSGDFEDAIREGATVVRIGQGIFGQRPTPDGHYWPGPVAAPPPA
ncbi:YggS family pyridoxal phosphate-dependent enzyme [Sulfitobacter sp. F26204]|uniref:YggS family pyridoxal phosphate-dependent enzyme n=1 Tax=Sulfitobacter sp. F26204 TaxID=2996014 RepID=UPI00225E303B|nr:YggS family pyridoxal phosphate-dependent enzyme [Sulfitobacter sp. F26204]MCX7561892.1 YggS family pyridoxal phosphate-dependent enzyme [Sulfitobacter sp. F26204]